MIGVMCDKHIFNLVHSFDSDVNNMVLADMYYCTYKITRWEEE